MTFFGAAATFRGRSLCATSETIAPKIQMLMRKKMMLAVQSPGRKVDRPKNSSW